MKRVSKNFALCAIFLAALSSPLFGKKQEAVQHAPLPPRVLAAKTIYIQNDSGYAILGDRAYTSLKSWGRYQIVDAKDKADLILLLTITSIQREGTTPAWVSVYNSQTGAWTNGTVQTPSTSTRNYTLMTLIDTASGDTAWQDRRVWRRKHPATEELVKSFRQRVEEQEAHSSH